MTRTALLAVMLLCAAVFAQRGGRGGVSRELPTPTAAVYVTGDLNESEKEALGSKILGALVASGRFTAAERSSAFTAAIGNEPPVRSDGAVDDSYIGRLAKQFGIRYVCIAGVSSSSDFYTVLARMLDVEKAKITASGRTYGQLNSMEALDKLSVDVAMEMGIGVYQIQLSPVAAPPPVVAAPSPPPPPPVVIAPPPPPPPPVVVAPPPPPPPPVVAAPPPPPPPPAVAAPPPPPAVAAPPPPPPPPVVAAPPPPPPPPPPPMEIMEATISIATQPPRADIYIGERLIGRSNDGELNVPIGVHQVRFVKNNFENIRTMTFLLGKNPTTFVSLTPPPPEPPPIPLEDIGASIIIHTRPPEAEVYVEGRLAGITNKDKLQMPIGSHEVRFVKDGLEKTEMMTFQPGENPIKVVHLDDGKQKKKSKPKSRK